MKRFQLWSCGKNVIAFLPQFHNWSFWRSFLRQFSMPVIKKIKIWFSLFTFYFQKALVYALKLFVFTSMFALSHCQCYLLLLCSPLVLFYPLIFFSIICASLLCMYLHSLIAPIFKSHHVLKVNYFNLVLSHSTIESNRLQEFILYLSHRTKKVVLLSHYICSMV